MAAPNFEKCTELATELLYNQNIKDRVLDIQRLNYGEKTILFDSIQNYAYVTHRPLFDFYCTDKPILRDGCLLIVENNIYIVLYNAEINYWEHLNWTLAHEIGHIYLGHTEDGPTEEIEAHFFAAQLFMPEYSIMMMSREHGLINADDLIEIFGVSTEAASRRISTMRKKCSFRASRIDKEIWKVQKERVDLYYQCKKNSNEYRQSLDIILYMEAEAEHELLAEVFASGY